MATPRKSNFSALSKVSVVVDGKSIISGLDINIIASTFNQLISKAHFCHHNTTSFATHKAMDVLYDGLNNLKDDIIEQSIGYTGQRYQTVSLTSISNFSESMCHEVAQEVMDFAGRLEDWAEMNDYCNIENLSQELNGVAAKVKYLLTLS